MDTLQLDARRYLSVFEGVPHDTVYSSAADINDAGQIVGDISFDQDTTGRAFLWERGVMTDLGTLGGRSSIATGINNRGQIVGRSEVSPGMWRGFLWQDGVMTDHGVERAIAINDHGQIVGATFFGEAYRGFLLDRGHLTDLGRSALGFAFEAYLVFGGWTWPPPYSSLIRLGSPTAVSPTRWNDETKCEAGALIDFRSPRVVVLHRRQLRLRAKGGDPSSCPAQLQSWTVRWADKGLPDITQALGVAQPLRDPWSAGPSPRDWCNPPSLISIRDIGRVRLHTSASVRPWRRGPQLLNDPLAAVPEGIPEWMPLAGMHIDVDDRFVGVWTTAPVLDLLEGFGQAWPQWRAGVLAAPLHRADPPLR